MLQHLRAMRMTYGQPETNPQNQQTESNRTGKHIKNAQNVPPYSNVAGEKAKREKSSGRKDEY